jgi:hypothetical protein
MYMDSVCTSMATSSGSAVVECRERKSPDWRGFSMGRVAVYRPQRTRRWRRGVLHKTSKNEVKVAIPDAYALPAHTKFEALRVHPNVAKCTLPRLACAGL